MPARILLVTDIFPPDIGGPASFISDLAHALSVRGHPVTVFCLSETAIYSGDNALPFTVMRTRRGSDYQTAALIHLRLARAVAAHDVIFSNGLERFTRRVCAWLRKPYVLKVVGDIAWEGAVNTGLTGLTIDAFQQADHTANIAKRVHQRKRFACSARFVITPSAYLRRIVIGWGVPPERVHTVLNGVRLDRIPAQTPQPRGEDPLHLIYVGRLVSWKGVEHLLAALYGLDGVHLTVVGDGPLAESLAAQVKAHALPVTFRGRLSREQTLKAMSAAHVLVLVSSYEGLSHTLIEAGAVGLARIASDSGGNPETIRDGEDGLLVSYGDVKRVREAIVTLCNDDVLRLKLARKAQTNAANFDFTRTLQQTIELLIS